MEKETTFMTAELGFKGLIEEEDEQKKIVFDGEISKVEEFKKLKKPEGIEGNCEGAGKKVVLGDHSVLRK